MVGLLVGLLIIAVIVAVVGLVFKALFWLFFVGLVLFVGTSAIAAIRAHSARP